MTQLATRAASVALLVVATALAAGCGTVSTPPAGAGPVKTAPTVARSSQPGTTASPVPTTTGGPPVVPGQPACTGWPANAVRGKALPASFAPVAVLRCVTSDQQIPGKGEWETATLERADQNLAPLVAALRHPSGQRTPGMMCPAIAMVAPQFVLVGGDGTALWPLLPLTGCGLVQSGVLTVLSSLSWQPVSVRLIAQVQTQQEVASGCTPQYTNPFTMYGPLRPSAGGTVFAAVPSSLRICTYSSGGTSSAPQFTGSATVTGSSEQDLLAGLSGAGHATVCTQPEPGFAVIGGPGSPATSITPGSGQIYVELGGCHRVLRSESQAGRLTGMATGQATPGAVATIESVTAGTPQ
ncbi:MAG TPA: hypothetical protein VMG13_24260 [Trebonia sp.]|nr:hypothetical protein [Trebonia sp.]